MRRIVDLIQLESEPTGHAKSRPPRRARIASVRSAPRWLLGVLIAFVGATGWICSPLARPHGNEEVKEQIEEADDLLVVDCNLPGRITRIGQHARVLGPPRPIKTTAVDCRIRGGTYVAYDRADYRTARKVWLSKAQDGDPEAQNYLGEIFEKGLGVEPDYQKAREWYERAADSGFAPAQINLGKLYEIGLGVARDASKALELYRRASGLPDLASMPYLQPATAHTTGEGPTIDILEPVAPLTRGVSVVAADEGSSERLIIGRVRAPAGLASLTVNGAATPADHDGIFRARVKLGQPGVEVEIIAVDALGQRAQRALSFRTSVPPNRLEFGRYHLLAIGNNRYRSMTSLETPRTDVSVISALLQKRYGFTVTTLYDATRYEILKALNELRKTLTQDDNLLIYYAGHGELNKTNDRGYWLPVDAEPDSAANWISNVELTDILNIMTARHIMVVADSCYSGTLTRSVLTQLRPGQSGESRQTYYRSLLPKRSRTALTSGANSPVLDSGPGGHSVFASVFIDVLRTNEGVLEGQLLFLEIVARVTRSADEKHFEQIPQYAPINFSGHEAGDFFLVALGEGSKDRVTGHLTPAELDLGPTITPALAANQVP